MIIRNRIVGSIALVLVFFFFITRNYRYQIQNAISYSTRPLWDHPQGPQTVLTHYYAEGAGLLCHVHGWEPRDRGFGLPHVWDAVLLSTELDLLEIRLNELDKVVETFFIVESSTTFTGLPKPAHFLDARSEPRFAKFAHKIIYHLFQGRAPKRGESPFAVEAEQRDDMTTLIKSQIEATRPSTPPLVIMSDVDEIPSAHTVNLLRSCAAPLPMHLEMRMYLYSFEWEISGYSWRAQVHEWNAQSMYRHSMSSDLVLADSGWHCSFCFRNISEFVTKMTGYSHADRLSGDESLLEANRIQKKICEGKDVFGMLPEAYSYKDMIQQIAPDPSKSAVGIPLHILENSSRFAYLLPGECIRKG